MIVCFCVYSSSALMLRHFMLHWSSQQANRMAPFDVKLEGSQQASKLAVGGGLPLVARILSQSNGFSFVSTCKSRTLVLKVTREHLWQDTYKWDF